MRLGSTNTGCATLTRHDGTLVLDQPGKVYSKLDIHGKVDMRAPGVKLVDSIARGGVAPATGSTGVIMATHANLSDYLIEGVTVAPNHPAKNLNGIYASRPGTIRRANISAAVDGIVIHGDKVWVDETWVHDLTTYPTGHSDGGPTHNDCIQIEGGKGVRVTNSDLSGASNAAIMVTQNAGPVGDLIVMGTHLAGGSYAINFGSKGDPKKNLLIAHNVFGFSKDGQRRAIIRNAAASPIIEYANTYDDGTPITVKNG
ncbi:MAG: hypothetical protein WC054_02395 [Candidatus Nanopelagicales bacterium]